MNETPYSPHYLNKKKNDYWVIEAWDWNSARGYLHDPDLGIVSGFKGAYRYADTKEGHRQLKYHFQKFQKKYRIKEASGRFSRAIPTYVSGSYYQEIMKETLGYSPCNIEDEI
jgi:hypothetical protein